jgi:FkbM family methyltransferase
MLVKNIEGDFFNLEDIEDQDFLESPSNFVATIVQQINSDIYRVIENYIDENSVVIDAGANIGYFSYYASPAVKEIHCFEPTPRTFRALEAMKSSANLENLVLNQAALGDHSGKCSFSICPDNETMNSVEGANGAANGMYADSIEVDCFTLADYLNKNDIETVDFIKIDIEGGEKYVLFDSSFEELNEKIKALLIEVHLFDNHLTLQSSVDAARTRLSDCGYICEVLNHDTILAINPSLV